MKAFIVFLLLSSVAFGQWAGWASRSTTTETTEGALKSVNDSLYYFNYPQSTTGNPIYYWWSSSAGYLYILADSLGVGSAGNPEATGMIKVDSLGDGSLHQVSPLAANPYSIDPDSSFRATLATTFTQDVGKDFTIEFWAKREHNDLRAFLMQRSTTEPILFYPGVSNFDGVRYQGYGGSGTWGASSVYSDSSYLDLDKWVHFAIVYDTVGTDSILVYQGDATHDDSLAAYISGSTTRCGVDHLFARSINAEPYDGLVDEIRFWKTARTKAQINAAKMTVLTGTETDLLYYYKFDNDLTSSASANTLIESWGSAKYSTDTPF